MQKQATVVQKRAPKKPLIEQEKIGYFIKVLRTRKGLTQKEFAKLLQTSQSAVARMERGGQNFTASELLRISAVLDHSIIALKNSVDFKIHGGRKLKGSIVTNTSKNGAMGLMASALLNRGTTILHDIPKIEEVNRMMEILESIGVSVRWIQNSSLEIKPPKQFKLQNINKDAACKVRSALMFIGSLIHHVPSFSLPHAGGCKMGNRTIAAHRYALGDYGVTVDTDENYYKIKATKLKPASVVMYEAGDTATISAILGAAGIDGLSTISFATSNYQVQEVCFFLQKLGVEITGIGTHKLTVRGIANIDENVEYFCSEDPIESMMFISAAIVTKSKLTITRCPIDFIQLELLKLEKMGLKFSCSKKYVAKNFRTQLVDITVYPSKLIALTDKIHALPYPGINSDNLPFFVPIATLADGQTLIHDWMWENRAIYFTELNRLGASIQLADPHRVFVNGPTKLKAAQVVCPPALRHAMIILIGMLGAEGVSVLRNVYAIERGYAEIAKRLNAIGAKIEVVQGM